MVVVGCIFRLAQFRNEVTIRTNESTPLESRGSLRFTIMRKKRHGGKKKEKSNRRNSNYSFHERHIADDRYLGDNLIDGRRCIESRQRKRERERGVHFARSRSFHCFALAQPSSVTRNRAGMAVPENFDRLQLCSFSSAADVLPARLRSRVRGCARVHPSFMVILQLTETCTAVQTRTILTYAHTYVRTYGFVERGKKKSLVDKNELIASRDAYLPTRISASLRRW